MSSMTGPVSGAKGKKNWEQLQQETDNSDGVQVKKIILHHSVMKSMTMLFQVQIMLRKGGKGGTGVRSLQVASDSSLGEQFIMREEREIR